MTETNPGRPSHRVCHLLITSQGLYSKTNSLKLRAHLIELLNIASGPNEILCHYFACILWSGYRRSGGANTMHTIWPALAVFLISMISFFSCCSSFVRSRSSSRCALARERWCWRRRSAGVTVRPKRVSWWYLVSREYRYKTVDGNGWQWCSS